MTAAMGRQIPSVTMKKGDSKKLTGINPNRHTIFEKSEEVNKVMQKFPKLSLTHIMKEAGFATPLVVTTTDLPAKHAYCGLSLGDAKTNCAGGSMLPACPMKRQPTCTTSCCPVSSS
jgi:hypothetical protein